MYLEMNHISMRFGSTLALNDVSFSIEKGEIHGLMGENGAGKSTLMNILGGVFPPTSGKVIFDGQDITGQDEKNAAKCGIRFIHQELSLINDLKVYENLFLGNELSGKLRFTTNRSEMRKRATQVLKRVRLENLNPDTNVTQLDTSQKQLIEIARALLFDAKLIIMDEPTTALSDEEIQNLFEIMRELKAEGVSMIYISHKMPELFQICDRYTVLRDGKFIGSGFFRDIDEQQATTMLVGQHVNDIINKETHPGKVILQAENISCGNHFRNLSFELRQGEVLVFSGLQGDGRGELAECLFGVRKLTSGQVKLEGKPLQYKSIAHVMRSGIGMVQRDRKERSIIRNMSILDNLKIAEYIHSSKGYILRRKKQSADYERCKSMLSIKAASPMHEITSLSGGNQQKVIICRWLELKSKVYIFDNPTQGIDVGAKYEIYKLINQITAEGASLIVFTSEYPEITKIADRCIVMYNGEIARIFERSELNETEIMRCATGSSRKVEQA